MSCHLSKHLHDVSERSKGLGLSPEQLGSLPSVQARLKREEKADHVANLSWCVGTFCALLAAIITLTALYTLNYGHHSILQLWVEEIGGGVLPEERCLLQVPEVIHDTLREPLNCNFCANVTEVVRVSNLKRGTFEKSYAYSGVPVIVVDAMDGWTALDVFSFEYFKKIYNSSSLDTSKNEQCQFFPYKTEFDGIEEVLNMSEERLAQPWYVGWSNCDPTVANELRSHYRKPYFLPEVSESSKLDWIFMGRPGYGAHMHIDSVEQSSWQAQVQGRKMWTLEPPPECYFQCPTSIEVTVQPGEIIVLDTNRWFHKTEVVGPDISIVIGSEYD